MTIEIEAATVRVGDIIHQSLMTGGGQFVERLYEVTEPFDDRHQVHYINRNAGRKGKVRYAPTELLTVTRST